MLSIVVVEYRSRPHIDRLLESVARHEPAAPIWISSNSLDPEATLGPLVRACPQARLISNRRNLGYSRAVNRALGQVTTPYVAILNPDVELTGSMSPKMHEIFAAHPQLGLFGPQVLDGAGAQTLSFRRFYTPAYILARYVCLGSAAWRQRIEAHCLMADKPRERFAFADWVSGGAMIVRMEACRKVGGMDERYFLYMEDMDWCREFWSAGWSVAYDPQIRLIHRAQHAGTRLGIWGAFTWAARQQAWSYLKYLAKWGVGGYSPCAEAEGHPASKQRVSKP